VRYIECRAASLSVVAGRSHRFPDQGRRAATRHSGPNLDDLAESTTGRGAAAVAVIADVIALVA
jgi:hypothetical protein